MIVLSTGQALSIGNIDCGVSMSKAWIQVVNMAGHIQTLWLCSAEKSIHHINYYIIVKIFVKDLDLSLF